MLGGSRFVLLMHSEPAGCSGFASVGIGEIDMIYALTP